MKKFVLATFLLIASFLWAQPSTPQNTISTSGGSVTIGNPYGGYNASFEEIPSGSPATVSVTVKGCMRGGTCDAVVDTNTSTNAAIRFVTFAKAYTYFVVTASWTGGTNPTVQVNTLVTTSRFGSGGGGGGGGSVTSVDMQVNGGTTSGIFSWTGVPITSTGTANFNISGTSGGVLYMSNGTTVSSSAVLGANKVMVGGGAGVAPSTVSAATLDSSGNLTVNSCTGCGAGGVFPVTVSGTVTSGGIPYFSSTTVETSSGVLASGNFVLGGGAGGAPTATFATVPVNKGGTGATTALAGYDALAPTTTQGDITVRGASTSSRLAVGTANQLIHGGTTPAYSAVVDADLSGQVGIAHGGTGAATAAAGFDALAPTTTRGDIIIRGASGNIRLALGTNGQCFTSNGTDGVWGPCTTGSVGGTGTANTVSKFSATSTIANSTITDDGTTVGISAASGLSLSAAGAPIKLTEGTAPTGSAGFAWIYDDSTAHRLKAKNASNTADTFAMFSDNLSVFATGPVTVTTINSLTPTSLATGFSIAGGTTSRTLTVDATVSTSALAPIASPTFTGTVTGTFSGNLTGNVTGNASTATTWANARLLAGNSVNGSANVPFANSFIVQGTTDTGLTGAQFLGALATGIVKNTTTTGVLSIAVAGDFPTLNQNTTGSAAKWTTPRTLAGNSVDGSANVAFTNKFIVQGTTDAGLSGAQFLGALGTGLMKNTTTTGVVSIATAADVDSLYAGAGKCYLFKGTTPGTNDGCDVPPGTLSGLTSGQVLVATSATTSTSYAGFTSDASGNVTVNTLTITNSGGVAGTSYFGQGTAPGLGTTAVGVYGAAAITSYNVRLPGAAGTGVLRGVNTSNDVVLSFVSASGVGACTNQLVSAVNDNAAPTCVTVTSAMVNTSVALTGSDINTSSQIVSTHLTAPLVTTQGGLGTDLHLAAAATFPIASGGGVYNASNYTMPTSVATNQVLFSSGTNVVTAGTAPIGGGGTGSTTAAGALINLFPTATRAGDVIYCATFSAGACTSWGLLAGNNSGTQWLQETASGVPSWTTPGGAGTVTNIATSSPITGGPITSTGTIGCATCTTNAAALTSTALMTGGGLQASQTPSATSTLDASGNLSVAAGGSVGSANTGTPKFTFATNSISVNQPVTHALLTNQIVTGQTTNLTTLNFPASSGAVTLTFPNVATNMLGGNTDTTTTHVLHATATGGIGSFSAIATGDLPTIPIAGGGTNATSAAAGTIPNATSGSASSWTSTPTLGASGTLGSVTFGNATSGTLTLQPAAGAITGTVLIPSGSDTLVNLTGTQTLTNKTLTSPTLTTPALGVATAASINKVAITAPATSSTLTVADGKTLTATNTIDVAKVAGVAGGFIYADTTTSYSSTSAGTAKQIVLSGGTGTPTMIDFPNVIPNPAANCVNAVPGSAWDTAIAPLCEGGTNNLGGYLPFADASTAQFDIEIPADWDSAVQPFINLFFESGANTTGTVIFNVATACTKSDGSVTSDPAYTTADAFATKTMAAATRAWSTSIQMTQVTSGNNCVPGGTMRTKITRATDTASAVVRVTKAPLTFPRLLTQQAN